MERIEDEKNRRLADKLLGSRFVVLGEKESYILLNEYREMWPKATLTLEAMRGSEIDGLKIVLIEQPSFFCLGI
jgi:hypothetical protein